MSIRSVRQSVGERIDKIIHSLWTSDYEAIVAAIGGLESDEANRKKRLPIAHRRAIADVKVLAAHKKRRPVAECETIFSDRVRLGFATVAEEAIATSAHARYCAQAGEKDLAATYARSVLTTIERSRRAAKPPVPPELEAALRAIAT
jgi:hypothetical protein